MTQQAYEQGNWQAVIDAHPLESHDSAEWLRYGAELAFVQAEREGGQRCTSARGSGGRGHRHWCHRAELTMLIPTARAAFGAGSS